MSSSKITLIGYYKYMDAFGRNIFEKLNVPDGIDKQTLTDNILLRGSEFEVIYADPDFLINAIGVWSDKWSRTFSKWIEALNIEYNPLENYDRQEDWTENAQATSNDITTGVGSSSTTAKVSAYNSETLQNDTQDDTTTNNSNTSNSSIQNSNTRIGRTHGNIGVTTSQQMLQSELDIARWNIYEHITDIFLSEFVIPVY